MTERAGETLDVKALVLAPAAITLLVTLARLAGELLRLSPTLFSREAGGALALVGIVWLVPVFGVHFALRLGRLGLGSAAPGRAAGLALAAFALAVAVLAATEGLGLAPTAAIGTGAVVSVAALWIAWRGWPALARTLLVYGLAARVPVASVMLLAIFGRWGTHYELGPPGFPEMGSIATWFSIGLLPQLTMWVAFTVLVGMLFGGLAALVASRRAAG